MKKIFILLIAIVCIAPTFCFASATDGTIIPGHNYAWSTYLGWFNWDADQGDVHITDSALTGYIWSQNYGWVNLAPDNGGVKNDGEGHLSGYAWGQSLGWGDYRGVTIDANGVFHGSVINVALQSPSLTFDCDHCSVWTDWRPVSARSGVVSPGTGGISIIEPAPMPISPLTPMPIAPTAPVILPPVTIFSPFNKNLSFGNKNSDVKQLQKFLNTYGFFVAAKGAGSAGMETEYFGMLTKKSVISFQEKYIDSILKPFNLKKGTGNFFERTRAVANDILKGLK